MKSKVWRSILFWVFFFIGFDVDVSGESITLVRDCPTGEMKEGTLEEKKELTINADGRNVKAENLLSSPFCGHRDDLVDSFW